MKYTKEERLDIGRRIYDGEISRYEAAEQYGISDDSARRYMRMYRDSNHLPPKVLLYHLPFQKRQVVIQIQFNKCRYSSAG